MSVFRRVLGFVTSMFGERRAAKAVSLFRHHLDGLDTGTADYERANRAVELCDKAITIAEQRVVAIKKLKGVSESLSELESFNQLDNDDIRYLRELLSRFSALSKDRQALINQLASFERSLSFMKGLEKQAPNALNQIKEAEEKQRIFRQDLAYLEGEKEELADERGRLESGLVFVHKATIGLVMMLSAVTIILIFLLVFRGTNVFFALAVIVFMVIVLVGLLYAFRRRIVFELAVNLKKQKRAVEFINKKVVLYAHYTNFLSYEYRKYRVSNSKMLKDNMQEYELYKHITNRLDTVRNLYYQTENEISEFLKENKISEKNFDLKRYTAVAELDNKLDYSSELYSEKSALESRLKLMDEEQERIWDELVEIEREDESPERLIEKIMRDFIDESGRVISAVL